MNNPPLYNSDREQTRQIYALAAECVISSSMLLVTGGVGAGKTHLGRVLQRRYEKGVNRKDEKGGKDNGFAWKPGRFCCTGSVHRELLFKSLVDEITGVEKGRSSLLPTLMKQFIEALQTTETSLLFLDNAHNLSDEDRENLHETVRRVREDRPFGVIMTIHEEEPEFDDFLKDPRSLAVVNLKPLTVSENLHGLYAHDGRFKPWLDRFKGEDRDVEAAEVAQQLKDITDGNFERLASLCRSLKHHVKDETLSLEQINLVLKKREGKAR